MKQPYISKDGTIDHLSPSQISMFLRCPKQWEYRYIRGLKIPPSGAMVLGSAYHEGLAERFRYVINNDEQPASLLAIDAFDTAFERIKAEHLVTEEDEALPFDEIVWDENPGELKDTGVKLLTLYETKIAPMITPIAVEEKARFDVSVTGLFYVPVHVITDLVTPEKIIDHKVKSRRFSEEDLKQDIQATAYWIAKKKPLDFHVALKTKQPSIEVQSTYREDKERHFFAELVTKIWQLIQGGIFPPNPVGWHCNEKWCGYWGLCKGKT